MQADLTEFIRLVRACCDHVVGLREWEEQFYTHRTNATIVRMQEAGRKVDKDLKKLNAALTRLSQRSEKGLFDAQPTRDGEEK